MTPRPPIDVSGFTLDGPAAEQVAGVLRAALRYAAADTEARAETASEELLHAVERLLDTRRSQARVTVGFRAPRRAGRPAGPGVPGGPYEDLRREIAAAVKESGS